MSTQGNEYQPIFSYLRALNFHFLDTWVIECVDYYKSVNPHISLDALKNEVKQQWLLVNLREIKVPSLPPALDTKEKVILNGNYAVQVESMIDSSVSCYSQLQKLLKIDTEDLEETEKDKETKEVKSKRRRCLTFVICDGVQEIQAMEYQPIRKIKTDDPELLPGFKMVIMGPVECRKGMILLKDENVRICGGEVDTLTASNSLKKILIRKLELDESDYSDVSPNCLEEEREPENHLHQESSDNFHDECVDSLLSQNDDLFLSVPLEPEILGQGEESQECLNEMQDVLNEGRFDDECIWSDDTINTIPNTRKHVLPEEDLETPNQKRLSLDRVTNTIPESSISQNSIDINADRDIFLDDFDEPSVSVTVPETKKPVQTTLSSIFRNYDSGSGRVFRNLGDNPKPVQFSRKPFVYLRQIINHELSQPSVFTVKAIILTLKKKITIENDEFNLKASITDGSSSIDVEFSSEVLEDLLGFSPCEMVSMLKARQTNSAIAQRVKESFSKAQEKLIAINCLMEVKFFTNGRTPVVLSLEEVTAQHVRDLKERMSA